MNHVKHPLSSADVINFSLEISKFCYIKQDTHRFHFDALFPILLTFLESLKIFNKPGYKFDDVSKNG